MNHFDVIVLGAGAAGMFCAGIAGQRGKRVLILESANKVGKKILMSGGGRCNFTNMDTTPDNFLSNNPHFCKSALARYPSSNFIKLVRSYKINFHEKELGQLFCDNSAKDIVELLLAECNKGSVRIERDALVTQVDHTGSGYTVHAANQTYTCTKLVVATGGLSVPTLGGTGYGYNLAQKLGHKLIETRPGLVPFTLNGKPLEQWADLSGVALPIRAQVGKKIFDNFMLITHRGLSGPAILQISNYWQPKSALTIDLLPHLNAEDYLNQQLALRPANELKTLLAEILPKRFAYRFIELYGQNKPMRQVSVTERKKLAASLHQWPIVVSGTEGYRTAEVTLGGVDTHQISSTTMESQCAKGAFFIGEVLDVTGWLGGYNFQWAWASAYACGMAL